ncbi:hypothetical protein D3C73_1498400 [compost metagenome]
MELDRFGFRAEAVITRRTNKRPQIDQHHHSNQRWNEPPDAPLPDRCQHLPVTGSQHPRQDQQQCPPASFIAIMQTLHQHRRRWPQQRHNEECDGLDIHQVIAG